MRNLAILLLVLFDAMVWWIGIGFMRLAWVRAEPVAPSHIPPLVTDLLCMALAITGVVAFAIYALLRRRT